jgi:hypothetical protein
MAGGSWSRQEMLALYLRKLREQQVLEAAVDRSA